MLPSLYHVLAYSPSCPSRLIKKLGEKYSLADLLAMSSAELREKGLLAADIIYLHQQKWDQVEQDLEWLQQPQHFLLDLAHPHYPPLLREIADPPFLLYLQGNIDLLDTPQIAMVGTRKPTASGREIAKKFAAALAKKGLTILSGLALGIDAASHEGALQENGKTIAVLGNGLSHFYPFKNRNLQNSIAEKGLLVSEFSPKIGPRAHHFPQRNRIISGLSLATLVVEAATRSGSLITARLAGEQGREVFAIPGSIHNPEARGCHALIKQGAKLVETIEDILEELIPLLRGQLNFFAINESDEKKTTLKLLDAELTSVLAAIDYSPASIDVLLERTGKTKETLFSALMVLELEGYIHSSSAGYMLCL